MFRKHQFPVRFCFVNTTKNVQRNFISRSRRLVLTSTYFSSIKLYEPLSRTTWPSNFFIFTRSNRKKTKNIVHPEVLSSNNRLYTEQTVFIRSSIHETVIISDAITAFENDCRNILDQISCSIVKSLLFSVMSLIAPNYWAYDSAIFVLLGLIDSKHTVTLDEAFVSLICCVKHYNVIESVFNFLEYQYIPSRLARLLSRSCHCQLVLTPIFSRDIIRNRND